MIVLLLHDAKTARLYLYSSGQNTGMWRKDRRSTDRIALASTVQRSALRAMRTRCKSEILFFCFGHLYVNYNALHKGLITVKIKALPSLTFAVIHRLQLYNNRSSQFKLQRTCRTQRQNLS